MLNPKSSLKFRLLAVLLFLTAFFSATAATAQSCEVLVWSDEFDGPGIDLTKWEHEVNGWGGGNNELQYYTDRAENSTVIDGKLHIIARDETYTGADGTRNYTSARLRSIFKGDWKYGRFEARIKLPEGQGMWPAFWMLPSDWIYGGWPGSGEIDIMENVGYDPNVVWGSIHYGDDYPNNSHTNGGTYAANASSTFHVYGIEWDPNEIRWYLDGQLYSVKTPADVNPHPWPFDQRFHFLLNVAVGGVWPGSPDATTVFPQAMEVDWVRVYQDDPACLPPLTEGLVFDDFEANRNLSFDLAASTGAFTDAVANPGADTVNGSAFVGSYVRSGAQQFDVLFAQSSDLGNANDYAHGRKVFRMDVYTDAPIGTKVKLQIEDTSIAGAQAYPAGRHSTYQAVTSVSGAWETLEFVHFETPDAQGVGIFDVDRIAILFDFGFWTNNTFYFDHFRIAEVTPDPVTSTDVIDDYENPAQWTYVYGSGFYNAGVNNPGADAVNGSSQAGRYDRNGSAQYDVLIYGTGAISNADDFVNGDRKILVDVYSQAPVGTNLSLNLEESALSGGAYPAGRHSVYQAKTTKQNQWETIAFEYAFRPDGGMPSTSIDRVVFLLNSNSYTSDRYYLDNVRIITYGAAAPANIALGRPVTASSIENAGLSGAAAVDGDGATRWSSLFADPQWIRIDLGSVRQIDRVKLVWEAAASANYDIQVSDDEVAWTTVYSDPNADGGVDDIALNVAGRYVRMYSHARTTQWGNSLWEFEVWGY